MMYLFVFLIFAVLALILWPARQHKAWCALVVIAFLTSGLGLYRLIGTPDIVPLLAAREEKLSLLKDAIVRSQDTIKLDPENLEAWVTLGQSFIETGQWDAAANAFKQSVVISGGEPRLIFAYAKSMILGDEGEVSDAAKKALEMVLLQEPKHEEARYFLAVRALQDGHTKEAMHTMKALYQTLSDDSPLKAVIDKQIGKN